MRLCILWSALALAAGASSAAAQLATAVPYNASTDSVQAAPVGGGYLANNYIIDDGTCENALGWTNGGDMVFIQRFTTVGPNDVITKVICQFGNPGSVVGPLVGDAVKIFVWDDPDDDLFPQDCVLISQSTGVVTNTSNGVFDTFTVPPAAVSGVFAVGISVWCPAGSFTSPMDTSVPVQHAAFLTGSAIQGSYTGVPLTGNMGLTRMTSSNFPCNWMLRAEGGSSDTVYCTAKITANSCSPSIGSLGVASATAASGHPVNGTNFINNKSCLLFYGVSGQATTPFQGGTLCVKAQIKRTPGTNTFGNPPPNDCSGVPSIDMNTFAQGGLGGTPLPALKVQGTIVDCQWWGRDPGFPAPNNTQLSNGLEYVVGP
jgi:hypothetical protein